MSGRRRGRAKPKTMEECFQDFRQLPLWDSRKGVSMKKLRGDWSPRPAQ